MKSKKKNPQDATLRNINALKKRVKVLEVAVRKLLKSCAVVALLPLVVCAETPNWALYDQRIAPKAQEYKDRWTFGNDDEKLANYYYDAADGFFYLSRRYDDLTLATTAEQAASFYANEFVLAWGGNIPGYWNFTDGIGMFGHGTAIISLSQNGAFCRDSTTEDTRDTAYSREVAYCIRAMLAAERFGEPRRQRLFPLVAHAQSHLEQWNNGSAPYVRPFMVGLTAISLIRAESLDPVGIRARLQSIATKMKNELWVESERAFRYTDRIVQDSHDMDPAPDLNLLVAPMFAWLGDREFAGKVFNGGIEQAYLGNIGSMKQFNQNVQFVEEFETWMTTPSPTPSPSLTPTPSLVPSPTPTTEPTSTPSSKPTPCQRPTLMNSIKKLDKWTSCELIRLEVMINE